MKRNRHQFYTVLGIWLTIGGLILLAVALSLRQSRKERARVDIDTVMVQTEFEDMWGKNLQEEDL